MLFITMCNVATKPPKRKSNVPNEAQWYGGKDGGAWILINSTDFSNQYEVVVYFDSDGSIWSNGLYKVCRYCQEDSMKVEEIRNNISTFDGESVILKTIKKGKYCTLELIE